MKPIFNPIPGVLYHESDEAAHYLAQGAWVDSSVGDALRATAQQQPTKPAVITEDRTITFAELNEQSERLGAALLKLGLQPGDRAVFQMGTVIETGIAVLACYKAGIIPVCAVPQYREVEIGHLIKSSGARAHFVQGSTARFDLAAFALTMAQKHDSVDYVISADPNAPEGCNTLEALLSSTSFTEAQALLADVKVGPRDVLSFQLSGGSTGLPKIIPRFHGEYLAHSATLASHYDITPDSRTIWSLPIMHNAGQLYVLMPLVYLGVTSVWMSRVDVERILDLIEQHQVTHALSIGPIAPQIINYEAIDKHDLSSLQLFVTMTRADKLEEAVGVPCSNLYGITEGLLMGSGAGATAQTRHRTNGNSGCTHTEIRVLDPESEQQVAPGEVGELCFKGPSSLRAYFGEGSINEGILTSDGFFRTGDLVTEHIIAGRSCYAFEGRLRDNINRGGEKIGCEEVEAYICEHPAVADAKLVAMPDELLGEKGCVYLILRPEKEAPTVEELCEFLVAKGMAKFKCPERIELVDEYPVTKVGKVDKAVLRQHIADLLEQEQQAELKEQHHGISH